MANKKKPTKILYTILGVVLSLVFVPLVIVVWQLVEINREAVRSAERFSQIQVTEDVANQVETYVNGHRDQIAGIAQALEASNGVAELFKQTREEQNLRLKRFLTTDPNLVLIGLIPLNNVEGQGAFAFDPNRINNEEAGQVIANAVSRLTQKPNEPYLSEPISFKSSNESAISIAEPVIAFREGEIPSVVIAVASMEPVFRYVNPPVRGKTNQKMLKDGNRIVFVVNEKGMVVVHPDREMVYSKPDVSGWGIVQSWMQNKDLANQAEQFELNVNSEKFSMLGSFNTVTLTSDTKLGVISVINEESAYPSVPIMIRQAVKISVVIVVIAVGIGVLLTFWVTSPIKRLAEGARAIATGEFSKRIHVNTQSEIGQLADAFNSMAEQIQRYINDLKFAANENRQLFLGTVRALAEAIDGKDPYTRGHSERVMQYSVLIAEYMGMNPEEIEDIRIAAILHDVGKIGIEDRILKKPAALTDEEYTIMKGHPQKGANIMSQIPQMKKYVPGMYYHHECMDGKGYPLGLKGDQIPMMARIISVADTFDAMTTNRPYQRAMEPDFAVSRIYTFSGTRYDPAVVKALDESLKSGRLSAIIQSYQQSQVQSSETAK